MWVANGNAWKNNAALNESSHGGPLLRRVLLLLVQLADPLHSAKLSEFFVKDDYCVLPAMLVDFALVQTHHAHPLPPYGDGFGALSGQSIRETNPAIFESLKSKGLLYSTEEYQHRYPCCWRCGEELAFRLAAEWFIRADEIRPLMNVPEM